jgi:tetratricopeptide (TPR) repeat protein
MAVPSPPYYRGPPMSFGSTATVSDLDSLLRAGRLSELTRALDAGESNVGALDIHRLRGELARRRRGPVTDLVAAARAHRAAGTPHAARLLASAAQALSRLGGDALAQRLLGEIPAAPDEGPEPSADEQAARSSFLAQSARGRGERGEAAQHSAAAAAAGAASDDAAALRLCAALDAWADDQAGALSALRAVRDDDDAPPAIRRQAGEVLDAIESEPARGATWVMARELPEPRAGGPLALLGRALGMALPERPVPTASHLRAALADAGVETLRAVLDEDLLRRLLGEPGVLLLLEEEQSRHAGFLLVRGLETAGRMLLVTDPAVGGAILRPLAEQWRRSELPGRGAIIVTGAGPAGADRRHALQSAGVLDDPRLALIDRCHFDPADPDVPFAHVAQLASKAVAAAPEIAMGHKRLGEALLGLLRLGKLDGEPYVERWVAETRERFPDAEWPHQIYAQALEHWGRWAEALIAWSDAGRIDPGDERNLLGQVRAAREVGGLSGNRHRLRRALAASPSDSEAWTWLAEEELAADRIDDAESAAQLAAALDSGSVPVALVRATVAERRGALDEATELLEAVADSPEGGQGIRLWRRYLCAGRWDDLRRRSERMIRDFPGSANAWSVYMDGLVALGDGDAAIEAIFASLQRVEGGPVDSFSEILLTFAAPDALPDLLARLERALGGAADPVARTARAIGFGGHPGEALAVLERLAERHPGEPNAFYALGQVRMLSGDSAGAREAFARAIEINDQFPWVRYLMAWLLLDEEPEQAIAMAAPAVEACPALFWDLIARALDRAGRAADAVELRGRLPELAGDAVEFADFLRTKRVCQPLRDLLELAVERAPTVAVRHHLALVHGAEGRHQAALDELLAAHGEACDPIVGGELLRAAALAGRGDIILERGPDLARACRADSNRYADPWIPEAMVAGAAAAAGDGSAREQFLARAGRHPHALRALARTTNALGGDSAADDLERLSAVAPGSAATIDVPEP